MLYVGLEWKVNREDYTQKNFSLFIENLTKDMGCEKRAPFPKSLINFISTELYNHFYPTKGN